MMINEFITRAKNDECVFIGDVMEAFSEEKAVIRVKMSLALGGEKYFNIKIPVIDKNNTEQFAFLKDYVYARVYNAISTFGGEKMCFGISPDDMLAFELIKNIGEDFGVNESKQNRKGYGKCLNVTDRVNAAVGRAPFTFEIGNSTFEENLQVESNANAIESFRCAVKNSETGCWCGIDVGGTDIKVVASRDGHIVAVKEYDWNPALFTCAEQMLVPIVTVLRAVRCVLSLNGTIDHRTIKVLLDKETPDEKMLEIINELEADYPLVSFNGIGLSFPDVVINHEIVGGETLKTKGMRDNAPDYEFEFAKFKKLNAMLNKYCIDDATIHAANDGSLAAYTAAVEWAWNEGESIKVPNGVFAHTLGTELGTGWIDEAGSIPQIPLEVYNCIIDLGSYNARSYEAGDARSILNFNTGIAGTLQKYTSQYGAYRIAIKQFKKNNPEEYQKLIEFGFIEERDGGLYVKLYPKDMRKPFLEYLMQGACNGQPEMEETFREIGECLAAAWKETETLLDPKAKSRVLFGRFVKKEICYKLMCEGARRKYPIEYYAANSTLAYTPLMLELANDPIHTVAQFGQAVGAIYFAAAKP